jgi:protein tyrosine phosphatase (PTP) superfamily phosphohydrolase (DUF442 family)
VGTAYAAAERIQLPKTPPEDRHGLHHVYHLSRNIVSGSEPHGEEAFRELREMGIRTILSVDGKVPDAELASKYGMSYVHVPIQYRGIPDDEVARIAKTFREKEGPFYVHCFHGKHRGPAAAAVGRLVIDGVSREQAIAEMRQWCGTAEGYEGLYRAIADGKIPTPSETRAYEWDFPSAHALEGFRHAMVEISRIDDNLKFLARRNWEPDPDHPDVDPLRESESLAAALDRTASLEEVASKPMDFRGWISEAASAASGLRDTLGAWRSGRAPIADVESSYERLTGLCNTCHEIHRND